MNTQMDEQKNNKTLDEIVKDRPFHPVHTENNKTVFEMNEDANEEALEQWCSELVDYIVENCEPVPPDLDMSKFEPL